MINKMAESGAVYGMEVEEGRPTTNCSLHVEETEKKTPMHSCTTLETWPSAVLNTGAREINDASVVGARYFVTLIYKALGHVSA